MGRRAGDGACRARRARAGRSAKPPGEPHIVRGKIGPLQVRRAQAGRIDHDVRQNFLAALSATANVVLSAAAAGYSTNAIYVTAIATPPSRANGDSRWRWGTNG